MKKSKKNKIRRSTNYYKFKTRPEGDKQRQLYTLLKQSGETDLSWKDWKISEHTRRLSLLHEVVKYDPDYRNRIVEKFFPNTAKIKNAFTGRLYDFLVATEYTETSSAIIASEIFQDDTADQLFYKIYDDCWENSLVLIEVVHQKLQQYNGEHR